MRLPTDTVLLLIDWQVAITDDAWGELNNPHGLARAADLLTFWRLNGLRIVHVRHDSLDPGSPYRPGQPGNAFLPVMAPIDGETVVAKNTNSAFIGGDLEQALERLGTSDLVASGVLTQNSLEATVRHGGNLGYQMVVAADACRASAKRDLAGRLWSAEEVHQLSLANLDGEYARISDSEAIFKSLLRSLARRTKPR